MPPDSFIQIIEHLESSLNSDEFQAALRGAEINTDEILSDLHTIKHADIPAPQGHAQTLSFLQKFIKIQIQALQKSDLFKNKNPETIAYKNNLIHMLAELENIASPQDLLKQTRMDRNQQRTTQRQEYKKEKREKELDKTNGWIRYQFNLAKYGLFDYLPDAPQSITTPYQHIKNGYHNWSHGTLTDDQNKILEQLKQTTALSPIHLGKIAMHRLEDFHDDAKQNMIATALLVKIGYDIVMFTHTMTGTHDGLKKLSAQVEAIDTGQIADIAIPGLSDDTPQGTIKSTHSIKPSVIFKAGFNPDNMTPITCLSGINTQTNSIGFLLKNLSPESCPDIRDSLQTFFTISTGSIRATQDTQREHIKTILKTNTSFTTSYIAAHEEASAILEKVAFVDNSLHLVLLAAGALAGLALAKRHSLKAMDELGKKISTHIKNMKERPLPLTLAFTSAAGYLAANGFDPSFTMVPYAILGALLGTIVQNKYIHLTQNKDVIFALNKDLTEQFNINSDNLPQTSLDQKKSHKILKALGIAALTYAGLIIGNNMGLINVNSPEALLWLSEKAAELLAYANAGLTWLIYDRFEDIAYHQIFFGAGLGTGVGLGLSSQAVKSTLKSAWKNTSSKAKKIAKAAGLSLTLAFSPMANAPINDMAQNALQNMPEAHAYALKTPNIN